MKIHLLQIPIDGKHIEGEESNAILDLHEPDLQPVGPVHYSLDVGVSDGGLWAIGKVGAEVRVQCVKCLAQFLYPVEVSEFACQIELTGSETVDLTEPVREDILLALPAHPHCDWNGVKVCPGAFQPPLSETPASEQPTETPDVWGALDQLKLNQ